MRVFGSPKASSETAVQPNEGGSRRMERILKLRTFGGKKSHKTKEAKQPLHESEQLAISHNNSKSKDSVTSDKAKGATKTEDEAREQQDTASHSSGKSNLFSKDSRTQLKAVAHHFGEPGNIKVEQGTELPALESRYHVVIRVQASTVTLNDCLLRRGLDFNIFNPSALPFTPGSDVVGTILECGDKVTEFSAGDRVAALVRCGGNARFISVPADSLVKISPALDSAEVAAMVSIYSTAYQAMRKISGGGPMFTLQNKKVLIIGGMDGVGQALIQMCKKGKADIYATAPKQRHIYLKTVLGATPLPEKDWLSQAEGEFDYVFDGECDTSGTDSFKAVKSSGELVRYGNFALLKEAQVGVFGAPMSAHMNNIYNGLSSRVHTVDIWESFRSDPATFKDDIKTLCQLLKWNKMTPHIAKRVSLSEVASVQKKLENGSIRGTIVCFPWRTVRAGKIAQEENEDRE